MSAPAARSVDLADLREEADAQAFARFDPTALCRLALVPEWTDDLACKIGLWTHGTGPTLLDELEEADLIERRPVLAPGGRRQEAFWIRARTRIPLAAYLRKTWRTGIERDLDELVKAIGRLDVGELGLRAWIEVVTRHRADTSGLSLVAAVDELVATGQALAEATDLVGAARAVGEVTGGPLVDASRRASWRVDRAYRAAVDKGALRFYLNRAGVEEALDEVIGSASGSWALHLLGDGGVGKTMLVRYLASGRYAEERGRAAVPVARADFDHIDPRYPEERPAELLLVLAHELVSFGTTRDAYKFLRQFQDAANVLHEECARPEPDPGKVQNLLGEAVRRFARIVAEAGGPARSPVVLVLDTCEELAKLYPPGASAPAIDRTFDMLETLKETLDKDARAMCVVLAGRRWLTRPTTRATGRRDRSCCLARMYGCCGWKVCRPAKRQTTSTCACGSAEPSSRLPPRSTRYCGKRFSTGHANRTEQPTGTTRSSWRATANGPAATSRPMPGSYARRPATHTCACALSAGSQTTPSGRRCRWPWSSAGSTPSSSGPRWQGKGSTPRRSSPASHPRNGSGR